MKLPALALGLVLGAAACGGSSGPAGRDGPPAAAPSTTVPPTASPAPAPGTSPSPSPPVPPAATAPALWATYQEDAARLGVAPGPALRTPLRRAWSDVLDGTAEYGQPLLAAGRVIVATEGDDLYALDARSGAVAWEVGLGVPLRHVAAAAGCGDVDPLGVTSTPVVDPATGVAYAVAETVASGTPRFVLFGVRVATGTVVERRDVTPPLGPGQRAVYLLQRAALALGNGRVYIGYGGQYGDCGDYHGWVVAAPVAGTAGPLTAFDVTPTSSGGAVWEGGSGPAVAASGAVYVTTGNPNGGGPDPWAESVLELTPAPARQPAAAYRDGAATGDLDLATGAPVLLPDGTLFAAGKTDTGFLLRQAGLALVDTIRGTVCGSDPDGGAAYDAALGTLYVPCRGGGIQEIDLGRRATGWRAGAVNSTPILVGGALWALAYPGGRLEELDPASGRAMYDTGVGRPVPTFASPAAGGGLLVVPTTAGVVAFAGSSGPPG